MANTIRPNLHAGTEAIPNLIPTWLTIEHVGLAHDEVELEMLKAPARQRMAARAHTITAADPPPHDLCRALEQIHR
jgi:hypothetical protein